MSDVIYIGVFQMATRAVPAQGTHGRAVGAAYSHRTADMRHLTWRNPPTPCTYPTILW